MEKVEEILRNYTKEQKSWRNYYETTKKNIETIEDQQEEAEAKCKDVDGTISTIKTLSQDARKSGYAKISPLCHIFATIKHTGEYNVHFNDNYNAVLTSQQTIDYLERKKKDIRFDLEMYGNQIDQLTKRLDINVTAKDLATNEFSEMTGEVPLPNIEGMPERIESDLGVAFKSAGLFEILEVDETPFVKDNKRISRIKQ